MRVAVAFSCCACLSGVLTSCKAVQHDVWSFSCVRALAESEPAQTTEYATETLTADEALGEIWLPLAVDLVVLPVTVVHDVLFAW